MAALGANLVTLADVAKSRDKQIGSVAEVLVQENQMLQDIPYMEMNMKTYHIESIRSALPAVYYRKANQPIPATKSTIEERTFTAAHIESKSQMDEKVASRGGTDRISFNRWNQAQGHIQAHALEHASLFWYGSPSSSHLKVAGMGDIFYTLSTSEETSNQIIDGGGSSSDMCSIWFIFWGQQSIFGVYPAGTTAGLKRTDRSPGNTRIQIQGTDQDGNAGTYWGYEEDFEFDHGLVVKDYRQASRVCNIDQALLKSGAGAADLIDLMISGYYKIHNPSVGKGAIYVNRTIEAFLHKQALAKVGSGGGLTYDNFEGKRILSFMGLPIRRSDGLLTTEDQIT